MKKEICLIASLLSLAGLASPADYAADDSTPEKRAALIERLWRHDAKADTRIWPEGRVPLKANDKPIRFVERELKYSNLVVTDINDPFFTFFPAAGDGAKPVAVILPGGGYSVLGWNKEGTEVAAWLNANGVSAAVLLYRAPDQREAALCDVQRTIGILRSRASEYGVRPDAIGVIGFSAGANLAIRASTDWRTRRYARVDAADDVSCRPDFQLPIYPWDILPRTSVSTNGVPRKWQTDALKLDPLYAVDAETPPAFIVQAQNDFCQVETAIGYYLALRRAGIPSALHAYPDGQHGYGLRRLGTACDVWSDAAADWLKGLPAMLAGATEKQGFAATSLSSLLTPPAEYAAFKHEVRLLSRHACKDFDVEIYEQANGPATTQRVMMAVPRGLKGKAPCVIAPFYFPEAMLGFNPVDGSRDAQYVRKGTKLKDCSYNYMRDLTRRGYITLSADAAHITYRRSGEFNPSTGSGGAWEKFGQALLKDWPTWSGIGKLVFDTRLVVDLAVADPRVDATRIGMVGHSLGGKMAFYAGMTDPRVKAVVSSDFGLGWTQTNWHDCWYWGDKLGKIRSSGLSQVDLLSQSGGKPFCLIAGAADDADSGILMRSAKGYEGHPERLLLVRHGTGHNPPPEATEAGYRFLDRFLK